MNKVHFSTTLTLGLCLSVSLLCLSLCVCVCVCVSAAENRLAPGDQRRQPLEDPLALHSLSQLLLQRGDPSIQLIDVLFF